MFSGSRCCLHVITRRALSPSTLRPIAAPWFPTHRHSSDSPLSQSLEVLPSSHSPLSTSDSEDQCPHPPPGKTEENKKVADPLEKLSSRDGFASSQNKASTSVSLRRPQTVRPLRQHANIWLKRKRSEKARQKVFSLAFEKLLRPIPLVTTPETDELWLTKAAVERASGTVKANRWIHHVYHGCTVIVTGRSSDRGNRMQILLRGASSLTRSQTKAFLLSLEEEHDPIEFRWVQTGAKYAFSSMDRVTSEGSVKNLSNTAAFLRQIWRWTSEDAGPEDTLQAADQICALLSGPNSKFASAVALEDAFRFLGQTALLVRKVWPVYGQLQAVQLAFSKRAFSLVLQALLRGAQLGDFGRVLNDMSAAGFEPDQQVWQTLLNQSAPWPGLKARVMTAMTQKGFMKQLPVRNQLAVEAATHLITRTPGILGDEFVPAMDARFSRDWMSEASLVHVWRACWRLKAWPLALDLLQEAQSRGISLGPETMSPIMLVLQGCGSIKHSITFLRSHLISTTGHYNREVIPILFSTAWNRRFSNVCKVIWYYAATKGMLSKEMQRLVRLSLYTLSPSHASGSGVELSGLGRLWRARASTMIAGIDSAVTGQEQKTLPLLAPVDADHVSVVSIDLPLQSQSRDWNQMVRLLVDSDAKAALRFAAPSMRRFFNLLDEAYELDELWRSNGLGPAGNSTVQWMAEKAIKIPLLRLERKSVDI